MRYIKCFFIAMIFSVETHSIFANRAAPQSQWICSGNTCSFYAETAQGNKLVFTNSKGLKRSDFSYSWEIPNKLASVFIPCGSPCSYTYYVNTQTGQTTKGIFFVLAENLPKMVIVAPSNEDDLDPDNTLIVMPIFNPSQRLVITRNFNPFPETSISDAHFDRDGNLYLDYVTGPNYDEVKETIPINYQKLMPENATS